MTQVQPAFWANYRGRNDPQLPPQIAYTYTFAYTIVGQAPVNLSYTVQGPPQLTRENYVELKWTPIVGLLAVTISRGGTNLFQSNGAEQGCVDQGQIISSTTGVQI